MSTVSAASATTRLHIGESLRLIPRLHIFPPDGPGLLLTGHCRERAVERFGITPDEVDGFVLRDLAAPYIPVAKQWEVQEWEAQTYERWLLEHLTLVVAWDGRLPKGITCYPNDFPTLTPSALTAPRRLYTEGPLDGASMHNNIMASQRAVDHAIRRFGQSGERQIAFRWIVRQADGAEFLTRDLKAGLELYRGQVALLVVKRQRGLREVQECAPLDDQDLLKRFGLLAKPKPVPVPDPISVSVRVEHVSTAAEEPAKEVPVVPPVDASAPLAGEPDTNFSTEQPNVARHYEILGYARCTRHAALNPGNEAAAWLPKGAFYAGRSRWGTHVYCKTCMNEYRYNQRHGLPVNTPVTSAEESAQEEDTTMTITTTPSTPAFVSPEATPISAPVVTPTPTATSDLITLEDYLEVADDEHVTAFTLQDAEGRPVMLVYWEGKGKDKHFRLLTTDGIAPALPMAREIVTFALRMLLRKQPSEIKGFLLS